MLTCAERAQQILPRDSANYFDLEYPPHAQRLEQATQTLESLAGLVVIDEVQLRPGLFPLLRTLMRQAGESLLGRVETLEVSGFDLAELSDAEGGCSDALVQQLWLRGGFPRAYLAANDQDSYVWRMNAVADHVRVDMPQFGINIAAPAMLRFWTMLARYHGQVWSAAPFAATLPRGL